MKKIIQLKSSSTSKKYKQDVACSQQSYKKKLDEQLQQWEQLLNNSSLFNESLIKLNNEKEQKKIDQNMNEQTNMATLFPNQPQKIKRTNYQKDMEQKSKDNNEQIQENESPFKKTNKAMSQHKPKEQCFQTVQNQKQTITLRDQIFVQNSQQQIKNKYKLLRSQKNTQFQTLPIKILNNSPLKKEQIQKQVQQENQQSFITLLYNYKNNLNKNTVKIQNQDHVKNIQQNSSYKQLHELKQELKNSPQKTVKSKENSSKKIAKSQNIFIQNYYYNRLEINQNQDKKILNENQKISTNGNLSTNAEDFGSRQKISSQSNIASVAYKFCSKSEKTEQKQEQKAQSESQQQQQEQTEQTQQQEGRSAKPEQENEDLQSKREKINYGWQAWRLFFWGNVALLGYNIYLESYSPKPQEELGSIEFYANGARKIIKEYRESIDFFTKPPVKQLLQDIPFLPPGMEPPKTIVLNLTGTLIHSNYVFGKGTEVQKRPGLQKFLRQLSQQFEVVVFTDDETMFTFEIVNQLDKSHSIFSGRFGRESMVYDKGQHVKDLRYLNRDLSKVIVIDKNPEMLKYHTDNGIFLPKFEGDQNDKELLRLLPFIQYLGSPQVKDVRKEISKYGNYDPASQYLEELKAKQQVIQKKQSSGFGSLIGGGQQFNFASQKY
ncbi:HAD-like domain [Pseudocohnilembus persalinus]|uniref:HAD-like domain n=1 Tax=Pseudocohnilembus persalinus TaxID=266149 RepID=A0A0V0QDF5_PSEPJ|nr:HAD-like domain [Pseudocohnilembus persalinus]|eukprot:KRX00168.1 HAD-like domain [Pseudocohnilembus persalinus]